MAHLAQAYVHLKPYELTAEGINRLGSSVQESAIEAARNIYRGNVTVDIELEEGSAKLRATVLGVLAFLGSTYMFIGNYKGFIESVELFCEHAKWFGETVSGAFTHQSGAQPKQVFRVERRLQTPGKIKRLTKKLDNLQTTGLNAAQLNEQLEDIRKDIEQIEKDISEEEKHSFHTMLLEFENLHPMKGVPLHLLSPATIPAVIRPQLGWQSSGEQLVSHGLIMTPPAFPRFLKPEPPKEQPLVFRNSVFVPPIDDGDGPEKGKDTQPITT